MITKAERKVIEHEAKKEVFDDIDKWSWIPPKKKDERKMLLRHYERIKKKHLKGETRT